MATVTKRRTSKTSSSKPASKIAKGTAKNGPVKNGAAAKAGKSIYYFSKSKTDGRGDMKPLLGGKGANLAAMTQHRSARAAGLHHHHRSLHVLLQEWQEISADFVERREDGRRLVGKRDGQEIRRHKESAARFVRSGARDSMPGMMDTILNLGLNDNTVEALQSATGNGRFAWDSYRRFVQMYGDVVMGVQKHHENEHEPFDEVMDH